MNSQAKDASEEIVDLVETDLPLVKQLLQGNELPYEDCYEHIDNFVGVYCGKDLIAVGGIENLGKTGLLRSIAVKANKQGQGFGNSIVRALQQRAAQQGMETLYLLTESAGAYFHALGYQTIGRESLPAEIRQTKQFRSLCPASAQAMFIRLPVDTF